MPRCAARHSSQNILAHPLRSSASPAGRGGVLTPSGSAVNHSRPPGDTTASGSAWEEGKDRGSTLASHQGETGSIPRRVSGFSQVESCRSMTLVGGFSRGSPVSPTPSFRHRSILTSITLTGSQDLVVKSHPDLFNHSCFVEFLEYQLMSPAGIARSSRLTSGRVLLKRLSSTLSDRVQPRPEVHGVTTHDPLRSDYTRGVSCRISKLAGVKVPRLSRRKHCTAHLARRSAEALDVRVSVARISLPRFLTLDAGVQPTLN
ncbi:hypothetical protein PR048_002861 [Dryococelus australis]|uniref:Uncharacterized protein n=1 Tax=Dryococelus australis TaxID=614101 RepID=A0ABQ9ILG3_9NEOP|nr:hypothetical protein PR048_002861 [Dryococelus australis]